MRRRLLTLYILLPALLLSGCQGDIFASRRDMERLRPVQTLAADRAAGGYALSVSTGIGPEDDPPLVMTAEGRTIDSALRRLQDYSPEDELFYAHVRYLLLGEDLAAGDGLSAVLDWVERSPAMRMETPLLLLRGSGTAAVSDTAGEHADITERLASLEREEKRRGRPLPTLRQIAADLTERGCALIPAAEPMPAGGTVVTGPEAEADALVPLGLAVLRPGRAPVYLTPAETLGAELLTGGLSGAGVTAGGCALELISAGARAKPVWDGDGGLAGLHIICNIHAGLTEAPPAGEDAAAQALADTAVVWLRAAVGRAQGLSCDYLGLRDAAETHFYAFRRIIPEWDRVFPALPVAVTVEARTDRNYDLIGEAAG